MLIVYMILVCQMIVREMKNETVIQKETCEYISSIACGFYGKQNDYVFLYCARNTTCFLEVVRYAPLLSALITRADRE